MRYLFSALPAYGHVFPMVPLAQALERAGHDVAFAVGAPFAANLPLRTIDLPVTKKQFDAANASVSAALRSGNDYIHSVATMMARTMGEPMRAALMPILATEKPDVVITEYLNVGARVAALAAGVRAWSYAITAPGALNVAFADYAATIHGDRLPATTTWRDLYAPLIDPTHPALRHHDDPDVERLVLRPEAWSHETYVPAWLQEPATRPRILATLGTVFNEPRTLLAMARGLGAVKADVLAVNGPDQGPILGLSPNIRQAAFVAQHLTLPLVDLVVHHGGSGTCAGAIAHGIPQVIVPRGADQFSNAEALAAAGAAITLTGEIRPEDVRAAAQRALDPHSGLAVAARRLQEQWRQMPPPDAVAAVLR